MPSKKSMACCLTRRKSSWEDLFHARREKELGEKAKKFTNVYIKNFGDDLTDDKLKEMFNKFGKITSYKVVSFMVLYLLLII